MNITIDDSKTNGLNAIVSRINAVEGAEQTTAEAYLTTRVNDILASYDASEVQRVMDENAAFYAKAALLPPDVQQQLRDLIAAHEAQ